MSEMSFEDPTTLALKTREAQHIPCFLLETQSVNEDFRGREDILERLATELLPSKNAVTASDRPPRQFALCGFGGIGKTEIAREFVRRHLTHFDAVFWVKADEIANLDLGYLQISLALGLEDMSQFKSQAVSKGIQDSLSLINHFTGKDHEPANDAAPKISDALGGIPLAISQMAGISRRYDLTLVEFLELYNDQEERAKLYETDLIARLVSYRHSLSTVWAFDKLSYDARLLLELISFFDSHVIQEDLLIEASAALLSADSQFKKRHYIEPRAELFKSSLVHRNGQKQSISTHRIIQDAIFARIRVPKKRIMFDHFVRILWAKWPSKEPERPQPESTGGRLRVKTWSICAALHPHVLRVHQLWSTNLDLSEATKIIFANLLLGAGWYQKERGCAEKFVSLFETARTILESSTDSDRALSLACCYLCLGAIAMNTNDFDKSRDYDERAFDLVSKIYEKPRAVDDERYEGGEADLKEALRIRNYLDIYEPRSDDVNLGWALLAQGKLEEYNTLLLDCLAREKALQKDDPQPVRSGLILYVLGNLRASQGQSVESFDCHRRVYNYM